MQRAGDKVSVISFLRSSWPRYSRSLGWALFGPGSTGTWIGRSSGQVLIFACPAHSASDSDVHHGCRWPRAHAGALGAMRKHLKPRQSEPLSSQDRTTHGRQAAGKRCDCLRGGGFITKWIVIAGCDASERGASIRWRAQCRRSISKRAVELAEVF